MAAGLWAVSEAKGGARAEGESELLGYAVGVSGWILTAGVYIAAKAVIGELPPWTLCFFRVAIATVALLPLVRHQFPEMRAFLRRRWLAVLVTGGLGLAITQGILYVALAHTTAMNAGIVYATCPIITMILAAIFLHERMTWGQGLGSLIAFGGVAYIAVRGSLAVLYGFDFQRGDLLVIVSAVCFSTYTVLLKRERFELPRLPLLVTLLGAGTIVAFPFFVWEVVTGQHENLGTEGILALLYCALPGGALMYLLYNWSIEILGAARGGSLMYLQMIFVAFLAWLLLGERIEWFHFVGMALILAGIALVLGMRPKRRAEA